MRLVRNGTMSGWSDSSSLCLVSERGEEGNKRMTAAAKTYFHFAQRFVLPNFRSTDFTFSLPLIGRSQRRGSFLSFFLGIDSFDFACLLTYDIFTFPIFMAVSAYVLFLSQPF